MISISKKHKAALASYLRSAIGAVAAVIATGQTEPDALIKAALAAILPPLLRWANPKDSAFGRGSSDDHR
jgi:hypothetical protein